MSVRHIDPRTGDLPLDVDPADHDVLRFTRAIERTFEREREAASAAIEALAPVRNVPLDVLLDALTDRWDG